MSTAQPSRFVTWSQSRGVKLAVGRSMSTLVMLIFWVVLFVAAMTVCGLIANSLPGVVPFEEPRLLQRAVLAVVFLIMAVYLLSVMLSAVPRGRRRLRIAGRARALSRRLLRVLGLIPADRGRRAAGTVGCWLVVGVVAGGASVGVAYAVRLVLPGLLASVPPSDARFDAVAASPEWVRPAFFAIYAPLPEELLYRGLLLAICAAATALVASRSIRAVVFVVALLGTSLIFGLAHIDWSLLNAASAAATGLVYGAAALVTRSLWPAVIGHALHNVLIFVV